MDKLVRRITAVRRNGENRDVVVVYRESKKSRKNSDWSRPFERVARHLIRGEADFAQEAVRRHEKSARDRRDGWIYDLPVNVFKAHRKGYNEARKAVPFSLLPKA
jgi:hypothetical protein